MASRLKARFVAWQDLFRRLLRVESRARKPELALIFGGGMTAKRAFHERGEYADGAIVEMTIWPMPESVEGSGAFAYRLFYGYPGRRVVGYDNQSGQGTCRYFEGREMPYVFANVETLVVSFLSDVRQARSE